MGRAILWSIFTCNSHHPWVLAFWWYFHFEKNRKSDQISFLVLGPVYANIPHSSNYRIILGCCSVRGETNQKMILCLKTVASAALNKYQLNRAAHKKGNRLWIDCTCIAFSVWPGIVENSSISCQQIMGNRWWQERFKLPQVEQWRVRRSICQQLPLLPFFQPRR